MKRKLALIMTVLLLFGSLNVPKTQAVLTLIDTDATTILPEGAGHQSVFLQFGENLGKVFQYDYDNDRYDLDDNLILDGSIDALDIMEAGSSTLSNDITGTAATASDLTCTDCIGTTEISDSYLLNNGDTGAGEYTLSSLIVGPTTGVVLDLTLVDTGTDDVVRMQKLTRGTKATTPAIGFGTGLDFYLANDAGTGKEAAAIDVVWEDVRDTREHSSIRFSQMVNSSFTETVRLDDAGNVGIGTSTPAAKLAINGGLHVGGDTDPGDNNLSVDGNTTIAGDIAVNGDDLTSDGDLTVTATGEQIYLGAANGSTDVIIDDGGLAVSSEAIAPSVPADGNVEIEDGSVCIGDGGCSPNAGDGYLDVAGNITVVGDIAVNGDDLTSDGDLTVTATGQQIYLGSGNGNTDVIIDDGGLAVSSDAVAPSTPTDGNVEIEDGSVCVGDGGCSPNAGDGYLHAANDISSATGYMYNTSTVLSNFVMLANPDYVIMLEPTSDVAWTDIDLTSNTSATATAVFLCMHLADTSDANSIAWIRKNGVSGTWDDWLELHEDSVGSAMNSICGFVGMDSGQIIEYTVNASGVSTANFYIQVWGYMEPTT